MSTPEYERWQELTITTPDDVRTEPGGPVPLAWQTERHAGHAHRLSNNQLPADFPYDIERGVTSDALACLALGESIRRDIKIERVHHVREALRLGATWREIAAALDIDPDAARQLLRTWAEGQHRLYRYDVDQGQTPLGLNDERYADVLALCDLADDTAAVTTR